MYILLCTVLPVVVAFVHFGHGHGVRIEFPHLVLLLPGQGPRGGYPHPLTHSTSTLDSYFVLSFLPSTTLASINGKTIIPPPRFHPSLSLPRVCLSTIACGTERIGNAREVKVLSKTARSFKGRHLATAFHLLAQADCAYARVFSLVWIYGCTFTNMHNLFPRLHMYPYIHT